MIIQDWWMIICSDLAQGGIELNCELNWIELNWTLTWGTLNFDLPTLNFEHWTLTYFRVCDIELWPAHIELWPWTLTFLKSHEDPTGTVSMGSSSFGCWMFVTVCASLRSAAHNKTPQLYLDRSGGAEKCRFLLNRTQLLMFFSVY